MVRSNVSVLCPHLDARARDVAGFSLIWREGFAHMTDTICDTKLSFGRVEIRTGVGVRLMKPNPIVPDEIERQRMAMVRILSALDRPMPK